MFWGGGFLLCWFKHGSQANEVALSPSITLTAFIYTVQPGILIYPQKLNSHIQGTRMEIIALGMARQPS